MMATTANYNPIHEISIFRNIDIMVKDFYDLLFEGIQSKKSRNQNFNIALSGGSTIRIFEKYKELIPSKINTENLHVYWGDERCVPPDNSESNYENATKFLEYLKIPEENINRIKGEDDPLAESLRYQDLIHKNIPSENGFPQFDLIMLGIGEDGHTASIFPDRMELFKTDTICAVTVHPVSSQQRITLTGKVINNAINIIFIATGKSKAEIIEKIIKRKTDFKSHPATHVLPVYAKLRWFLDTEAGALVKDYGRL